MKEYQTQDGEVLTYQYRLRKRKTAQLQMHPEDGLIVTVPNHWSIRDIEELIEKKRFWILKARRKVSFIKGCRLQPDLQDGHHFLYLGRWLPVKRILQDTGRGAMLLGPEGFQLTYRPRDTAEQIRSVVISWYKDAARQLLEERVEFYAKKTGIIPEGIRIKEQKKRWGSCTGDKRVLFNWRLVSAPEDVIDGVVVHELCHIKHMNHSKDFWNLVKEHFPEYNSGKEWLRIHGHQLFWMDEQNYWRNEHE